MLLYISSLELDNEDPGSDPCTTLTVLAPLQLSLHYFNWHSLHTAGVLAVLQVSFRHCNCTATGPAVRPRRTSQTRNLAGEEEGG